MEPTATPMMPGAHMPHDLGVGGGCGGGGACGDGERHGTAGGGRWRPDKQHCARRSGSDGNRAPPAPRGTHQPIALAKPPAISGAAKPPVLWAMFHIDQ
jgi:hypothetical protein